jgi:hypothetical protein
MFTPETVIGPELKEPEGPMLLTTLPDDKNETDIEPTAVAVCKLMPVPANRAKDRAVPVMLVPDALMVLVPAAPPAAADNWITPAPFDDTVMLTPLIVMGPEDKEPDGPMLLTTLPVVEIVIVLADELNAMPVPATNDTLLDVPFKLKLVAATAGEAEIVIVLPA